VARHGITIPFDGVPLAEHRDWLRELEDLGYSDVWSSEANGTDGFTPLALAAAWTTRLRLGVAVVPAFTRGPGLMAMTVAALAEAAPGRFCLGIGTSSDVIVERWNALAFDRPYQRTRDMVRFLRAALSGQRVDAAYETFSVRGFRLGRPPAQAPPILVGALRPGMLRLAGTEGDGAIVNWLSAEDVARVVPYVGPGKEVVARVFVCPSADAERVREMGRFAVAAYLNVPVYAAFHDWLGRRPQLEAMWQAWRAGDRKAAVAAIPDQVVDDLIVHGPPDRCREQIGRYLDNGVTTLALAPLLLPGMDLRQAVRELSPEAWSGA
jgi:probable F420-dependent oxidoreductase